ncbi:MAG: hypothetical protein LBH59_05390 [Planctomycetaceae bacterium]|nr:hypothetical protein [Planctomycetaceae bacterium]
MEYLLRKILFVVFSIFCNDYVNVIRRVVIPKPVGFALEQTLHVVVLTVFSYVDFKVASAY